jgi:hypothetical protein
MRFVTLFFQRKNYAFRWKLTIGHVLAVLLNYGANEDAVLSERFYTKNLAELRHAVNETEKAAATDDKKVSQSVAYGVEKKLPTFLRKRQNNAKTTRSGEETTKPPLPDETFKFCVSRFVSLLSEFSAGHSAHLDFVAKNDFSDLCVFLFLVLLVGTDRRFTTDFRVIESITALLHYNLETVSSGLWYEGPSLKDRQMPMEYPHRTFVRTLAKLVHEFFPGKRRFIFLFFINC